MIPCVSLAETSVIGNMKERVKEMKVFGCRLNFWNHIGHSLTSSKTKEGKYLAQKRFNRLDTSF